jgi:hypothetical protein
MSGVREVRLALQSIMLVSKVLTSLNMKSAIFWVVCPYVCAGFLLDLLLCLDERGNIFLRNVELSPNYIALQPTRPYLSNHVDVCSLVRGWARLCSSSRNSRLEKMNAVPSESW